MEVGGCCHGMTLSLKGLMDREEEGERERE